MVYVHKSFAPALAQDCLHLFKTSQTHDYLNNPQFCIIILLFKSMLSLLGFEYT